MNTEDTDILFKDESEQVVGCAFEVLNSIGHGFHEKPYENALTVEFEHRQIPYRQQERFPILYRDQKVGEFIPDLIAFNKIIIDTKVVDQISNHEIGQMMNYLRITELRHGYLLNFSRPKLSWRRVVL